MGWCLYELAYLFAAGNIVLFFLFWAVYHLFRRRYDKVQKISSLGTVSVLVVALGMLVSEAVLEMGDVSDCDIEGSTAIFMMIVSTLAIIYVLALTRKREHVFNKKADLILSVVFWVFLAIVILMIALDGDLSDVFSFILMLPISILLFFFD